MKTTTDQISVEARKVIDAAAPLVYRAIADYREHHPHILPPAFSNLSVEQGGFGAGTVISFNLRLGGRKRKMRAQIAEPDPGRLLKEAALDSDLVTMFEIIPRGEVSQVSIRTEWTPNGGVQGWFERRFAPAMLEQLYADELTNLERYVREHASDLQPSA